jgi:hypothetical protein
MPISEKQQYDVGEKGPGLGGSLGRGGTRTDAISGLAGSLGRQRDEGHGSETNLQSALGRKKGGKK